MERRHLLIRGTALVPFSLAGCLDRIESPGDDRSRNRTRTTTGKATTAETEPVQTVSLGELPPFPEGSKEKPSPPDVWDEASAKSFAKEYERRRLYNEYHREDTEEITIGCTTPDVERTEEGYEVSLLCRGAIYEEASTTHGDYVGPDVVYRLTPNSVTRDVVDS